MSETEQVDSPREMPRLGEYGKPLYLLPNRYRAGFWSPKCPRKEPAFSGPRCLLRKYHPGPCVSDKKELKLQVRGL